MLTPADVRLVLADTDEALAAAPEADHPGIYFEYTAIFHDMEIEPEAVDIASAGLGALMAKYRLDVAATDPTIKH